MTEIVEWRPFQLRGRAKILESPIAALFFRMGLGKTRPVVSAINDLMYNRLLVSKVIVLAPKRVARMTWPEQIKAWQPNLRYTVVFGKDKEARLQDNVEVYIFSYSTLPWLYKKMIKEPHKVPKFDMVVYDEGTYLKHESSDRWKMCETMFQNVPRRVLMAGKPAPNGHLDLWAQMYLLDRGVRLFRSYDAFRSSKFIACGYGPYKRYEPLAGTKEWITEQISDISITVTEDDSVKLPPLIENIISCELPDKDKPYYYKLEKTDLLEAYGTKINIQNPAASLMKLRQFVQGFLYDGAKGIDIHNEKAEALKEIVDGASDSNILCAVQFKYDIDKIRRVVGEGKFKIPAIFSGTSDKDSDRYIEEWNKGNIPLLLAHPTSVAHGLNIQHGGNHIVWYGLPWNLDEYEQFIARLHRSGQTQSVIMHTLVMEGTIDELIVSVLKKKAATQNSLLKSLEEYVKARLN